MIAFFTSIKVGTYLAVRELRRSNKWTTILIIFVMTLTFLNLIVVRGVLVGLAEGSSKTVRDRYSGDIIITSLRDKDYIIDSQDIIAFISAQPEVKSYTYRYVEPARLESGYKDRKSQFDIVDSAGTSLVGIDPVKEDEATSLSKFVIEGSYLDTLDEDAVLIGASLLFKYSPIDSPNQPTLKTADLGSKIRLIVNGHEREVVIKGIVKTKLQTVDQRVYLNASQVRQMIDRSDLNVDEISIHLTQHGDLESAKRFIDKLKWAGFSELARIQTAAESEPAFLKDIKLTFNLLGNLIGSVGLIVASITIFIVIFVNAITRRKFIGVLKGIGVTSLAIEVSYIIQSAFYAFFGVVIGLLLVYGLLMPYFDANPINFPFSDGILVAEYSGTIMRALVLFVATTIAGFIPSRMIVRQNTLDAILGR